MTTWTRNRWLRLWRLDTVCGVCGASTVHYTNDGDGPVPGEAFRDAHGHDPLPDPRRWVHPWINPTGVFPDGVPARHLAALTLRER